MGGSLYVHVPLCVRKCAYCDFFSDPAFLPSSRRIADALGSEIRDRAREAGIRSWDTVYIGGGTPSLLPPALISNLCATITDSAPLEPDAEWTIEANPEDLSAEWLSACADSGINRLSLGVQSMHDRELSSVGRRGSRKANLEALELASKVWKGRLSLDFIAGLPGQSRKSLLESLDAAPAFGADHVSLYSLTLEEGTPLRRLADTGGIPELPEGDSADELWIAGRDFLGELGYAQYEVSNFSLNRCESRHNLVYWNSGEWLAAGPGASGTIRRGSVALRTTGVSDIAQWLSDPVGTSQTEELNERECAEEYLMMGMRLLSGVDRKSFELRFGKDILEVAGKTCSRWQGRGLLEVSPERIRLSAQGLLTLNVFLAECLEEMS